MFSIQKICLFSLLILLLLIPGNQTFAKKKKVDSAKLPSTLHITFDNHTPGKYAGKRVRADWESLYWEHCAQSQIVSKNGPFKKQFPQKTSNALRVKYPVGKIGASDTSGAQFRVRLKPLDEYYLDYYVRFGHGDGSHWDFSKGGKLPGLAGGKCNTGGNKSTGDGWSARYMWREKGKLILYLYSLDQKSRYGDQILVAEKLKAGRWYRLTQRIRLNTDSKANGIVQVWVDGKLKLDRDNIRFRSGTQAPIDWFLFSTFYGGSNRSWAPKEESLSYFDEFRIQPKPFVDLKPPAQKVP